MIKAAQNETTSSIISWNETGVPMIRIILCDDDAIFLERMRSDIRATLKSWTSKLLFRYLRKQK